MVGGNRESSKYVMSNAENREKWMLKTVAYPRGGGGVRTPTFLKYGPRDLSKNDVKLIGGGGGGSILYACVNNSRCCSPGYATG